MPQEGVFDGLLARACEAPSAKRTAWRGERMSDARSQASAYLPGRATLRPGASTHDDGDQMFEVVHSGGSFEPEPIAPEPPSPEPEPVTPEAEDEVTFDSLPPAALQPSSAGAATFAPEPAADHHAAAVEHFSEPRVTPAPTAPAQDPPVPPAPTAQAAPIATSDVFEVIVRRSYPNEGSTRSGRPTIRRWNAPERIIVRAADLGGALRDASTAPSVGWESGGARAQTDALSSLRHYAEERAIEARKGGQADEAERWLGALDLLDIDE